MVMKVLRMKIFGDVMQMRARETAVHSCKINIHITQSVVQRRAQTRSHVLYLCESHASQCHNSNSIKVTENSSSSSSSGSSSSRNNVARQCKAATAATSPSRTTAGKLAGKVKGGGVGDAQRAVTEYGMGWSERASGNVHDFRGGVAGAGNVVELEETGGAGEDDHGSRRAWWGLRGGGDERLLLLRSTNEHLLFGSGGGQEQVGG